MADVKNLDDEDDDLSKPLPTGSNFSAKRAYVENMRIQGSQSEQAQVIQANIDKQVTDEQIKMFNETWIKSYWRPAMAWLYMAICFMDFIGFPFLAGIQPIIYKGVGIAAKYEPWVSLTLQNGGLVHAAFGAILGVAAWTRGQEKARR